VQHRCEGLEVVADIYPQSPLDCSAANLYSFMAPASRQGHEAACIYGFWARRSALQVTFAFDTSTAVV